DRPLQGFGKTRGRNRLAGDQPVDRVAAADIGQRCGRADLGLEGTDLGKDRIDGVGHRQTSGTGLLPIHVQDTCLNRQAVERPCWRAFRCVRRLSAVRIPALPPVPAYASGQQKSKTPRRAFAGEGYRASQPSGASVGSRSMPYLRSFSTRVVRRRPSSCAAWATTPWVRSSAWLMRVSSMLAMWSRRSKPLLGSCAAVALVDTVPAGAVGAAVATAASATIAASGRSS